MKLYSMTTPSFEVLEREWFLPSVPGEFEVNIARRDHPGGRWGTKSFCELMRFKARIIRDAVAANQGEIILWSDVDVQFFAPVADRLLAALGDRDLAFQRSSGRWDWAGAGFFVCRCNPRTLEFWSAVVDWKIPFLPYDDERAVNIYLGNLKFIRGPNQYWVSWTYLPDTFFSAGIYLKSPWEPGQSLEVPAGVLAHHANWTFGLNNKIAMLTYVRDVVAERRAASGSR